MVKITIDNKVVEVPADSTILEAAASVGINIPTLCYLKDINEVGGCRVCIVEVVERAESFNLHGASSISRSLLTSTSYLPRA